MVQDLKLDSGEMGKKAQKKKPQTQSAASLAASLLSGEPLSATTAEESYQSHHARRPALAVTVGAIVELRNLKTERFNRRHAVVDEMEIDPGGRCRVSLLNSEDQTRDPDERPISLKVSNMFVVCGFCLAPHPGNRCSKCKGPGYCDRDCQLSAWAAHKVITRRRLLPRLNFHFHFFQPLTCAPFDRGHVSYWLRFTKQIRRKEKAQLQDHMRVSSTHLGAVPSLVGVLEALAIANARQVPQNLLGRWRRGDWRKRRREPGARTKRAMMNGLYRHRTCLILRRWASQSSKPQRR